MAHLLLMLEAQWIKNELFWGCRCLKIEFLHFWKVLPSQAGTLWDIKCPWNVMERPTKVLVFLKTKIQQMLNVLSTQAAVKKWNTKSVWFKTPTINRHAHKSNIRCQFSFKFYCSRHILARALDKNRKERPPLSKCSCVVASQPSHQSLLGDIFFA